MCGSIRPFFILTMINVHTDLIRKQLSKIGVDAFAVLLCITSHINPKRQAWPGIERLRRMTGLSRERTYKAIQRLIELKYISRSQENKDGEWGRVVYRVTSSYLSIFVNPGVYELESAPALEDTDNQAHDGNPYYGNPYYGNAYDGNASNISIDQVLSIDKLEVLENRKSANENSEVAKTIKDPLAYKTAKETFIVLAAAARIEYPAQFAEAYFLNEQQKGRYYMLTVPTAPDDIHSWLSKHVAGINAWSLRERQFSKERGMGDVSKNSSAIKLPKV